MPTNPQDFILASVVSALKPTELTDYSVAPTLIVFAMWTILLTYNSLIADRPRPVLPRSLLRPPVAWPVLDRIISLCDDSGREGYARSPPLDRIIKGEHNVAPCSLPTLEMPQQPAEVSPSPTLSLEQPNTLIQGTPSLTYMVIDPLATVVAPDDSHHHHKKHWRRHLVPRNPILLAYLASLLVTVFLFVAAVCNSGDHYAVDQLSPNENGVGS